MVLLGCETVGGDSGGIVPVEAGRLRSGSRHGSAGDGRASSWAERLIPLRDFIEQHLSNGLSCADEGGEAPNSYVAQHSLRERCPRLAADVRLRAQPCPRSVRHTTRGAAPAALSLRSTSTAVTTSSCKSSS